ncbi:MAG: phasin family protein [Anaerostipes sp.]|jgi:polyhydroxyalkanoate synthesis regulator phasin
MEHFTDGLKKIMLAGIGAIATTGEKSKDLLDEMVKKGELTVEQGKALNEELKHNIKETVRDKMDVKEAPSTPEDFDEFLDSMTPEQKEMLKEKLQQMDVKEEADE